MLLYHSLHYIARIYLLTKRHADFIIIPEEVTDNAPELLTLRHMNRMSGVLIIDKPRDWTSFDAVSKVRKITGKKKCGHCGTLDPMATGVLTVLLGGATRFADLISDSDKSYLAEIRLGIVTDTLDITGKVIEENSFSILYADFEETAKSFTGRIKQIPPMYSAVSVNGKRLYSLARQGIETERPSREVTVYAIRVISGDEKSGLYTVEVDCSSGTYIRTLADDIGRELGCGAVLTSLRRVKANGFTQDDAVTLAELEKMPRDEILQNKVTAIDLLFKDYPRLTVTQAQADRFSNGGFLSAERIKNCDKKGIYRVYSPSELFLGLGETDESENLRVKKLYFDR